MDRRIETCMWDSHIVQTAQSLNGSNCIYALRSMWTSPYLKLYLIGRSYSALCVFLGQIASFVRSKIWFKDPSPLYQYTAAHNGYRGIRWTLQQATQDGTSKLLQVELSPALLTRFLSFQDRNFNTNNYFGHTNSRYAGIPR